MVVRNKLAEGVIANVDVFGALVDGRRCRQSKSSLVIQVEGSREYRFNGLLEPDSAEPEDLFGGGGGGDILRFGVTEGSACLFATSPVDRAIIEHE